MNPPSPGLTVIVLTRDRRGLLPGCLASLEALDDPGLPLEFVVVDDGSVDGTEAVVRAWTSSRSGRRSVRLDGRGVAAARNAGIRAARTDWVAIVADDYILPRSYARAIAAVFAARPDCLVVRFKVVGRGGTRVGRALQAYHDAGALNRLPDGDRATSEHGLEAAGAAALRREVFDRVGLFDESYRRGEDTEFTERLRAAGIAVHYEPGVVIGHRPDERLGRALGKNFLSGRAARRLLRNRDGRASGPGEAARLALRLVPAAARGAFRRARRACRPGDRLPAWPILFLMESAYRSGYLRESIRPMKTSPAGAAPA